MGFIKEAGGDAALAPGDALIGLRGPFNSAALPEGPGMGACAGALQAAGWWVMGEPPRGLGDTPLHWGVGVG